MKQKIVTQMKSMIEEISASESKKHNMNMNQITKGYTLIEYLNEEALQKKVSLQKKALLLAKAFVRFKRSGGYYNSREDKIALLLDKKLYKGNFFIHAIFHECRHYYQSNVNDYIGFLFDIESVIISSNRKFYEQHHDIFLIEIDANQYGYRNTVEYLSKYNILSENQKAKYDLRLQLQECYLDGYNPIYMFHQFNIYLHEICQKDWFKESYSHSWLKEIYDISGNMKSYQEIFKSAFFKFLDETSQNIIMTSPFFLENLDIHNLNVQEKEMILRAIEYANKIKERNEKQSLSIVTKFSKTNLSTLKIMDNILYQKKHNFLINQGTKANFAPILEQLNQQSLQEDISIENKTSNL